MAVAIGRDQSRGVGRGLSRVLGRCLGSGLGRGPDSVLGMRICRSQGVA